MGKKTKKLLLFLPFKSKIAIIELFRNYFGLSYRKKKQNRIYRIDVSTMANLKL